MRFVAVLLSPFESIIVKTNERRFLFVIKVGDKIRIIYMDGELHYSGKVGVVEHNNDIDQIHGSWGGCSLIPGVDLFEITEERK